MRLDRECASLALWGPFCTAALHRLAPFCRGCCKIVHHDGAVVVAQQEACIDSHSWYQNALMQAVIRTCVSALRHLVILLHFTLRTLHGHFLSESFCLG